MKKEKRVVAIVCLFLALAVATVFVYRILLLSSEAIPVIAVYHYESSDHNWAEIEVPAKGRTGSLGISVGNKCSTLNVRFFKPKSQHIVWGFLLGTKNHGNSQRAGRTLEMVEDSFEDYKKWKGDENLQLFITSKPDPKNDAVTHRRWSYPYMEPSENPKYNYRAEMTPASN